MIYFQHRTMTGDKIAAEMQLNYETISRTC